jgi:hypothetical protein
VSLAALADEEILRTDRAKIVAAAVINPLLPKVMAELQLDASVAPRVLDAVKPIAVADPIPKTPGSNALDSLVRYIPTESVSLYVAAAAAISSISATFPWITPYSLYLIFIVLTPILFVLIYIGKRRSQSLPSLPADLKEWPWWKLFASTFAFAVWALAIPPLVATDPGKIVAAFGALLVSTLLSLVGAVVEPPGS